MPEKLSEGEELRRLREFLDRLQTLLDVVATNPQHIVPGRHHEALSDAWNEVRPTFAAIRSILNDNNRPQLEKVGLVGSKLEFELGVFNHAWDDLLDHAPELFTPEVTSPDAHPIRILHPEPPKEESWWARLRRLLRRCLRGGDVVLGSLAMIPVFSPAEIIRQFKEGLEESVALSHRPVEQ